MHVPRHVDNAEHWPQSCCINGNEDPTNALSIATKRYSRDVLLAICGRYFKLNVCLSGLIRLEITVLKALILGLKITKTSNTSPSQAKIKP